MESKELLIQYFASESTESTWWEWQHKDWTSTYLGMVGERILAPPENMPRGFASKEDATQYAREFKEYARTQRGGEDE